MPHCPEEAQTAVSASLDAAPLPMPAVLPPLPSPPIEAARSDAAGTPWGFWATLGFTAIILVATIILGLGTLFAAAIGRSVLNTPASIARTDLAVSGFLLALSTLLSMPVSCGLTLLFASLRRNLDLQDYLGLRWPALRQFLYWLAGLAIVMALSDTAVALAGGDVVPNFMIEAHQSAGFLPLFYFAIIVAAPLSEEFLFRGFLLAGLRHTRLGAWGAIALAALLWAGLHTQYDFMGFASVLFSGLFLGYARIRTGSLWLCIVLHGMNNLIASIELWIVLARMES